MTGKVKPEDAVRVSSSTREGLPEEIVRHLLEQGADGRVQFSSSSVLRVGSLLEKVLSKLVFDLTEDKRLSNQIRSALLAIDHLHHQRYLTLFDAVKTLNKIPLFEPFTPALSQVPARPKQEAPLLFANITAAVPVSLVPSSSSPAMAVTLLGSPAPPAAGHEGLPPPDLTPPSPPAAEPPRRRGRGRPPLKARTDAGSARGGPGAQPPGPASGSFLGRF